MILLLWPRYWNTLSFQAMYDTVSVLDRDKDSVNRVRQETTRMCRVLKVLYEYVSECDGDFGDDRSILPLGRYVPPRCACFFTAVLEVLEYSIVCILFVNGLEYLFMIFWYGGLVHLSGNTAPKERSSNPTFWHNVS